MKQRIVDTSGCRADTPSLTVTWSASTGLFKEQFVYWHIDELDDPDTFNRPLMEYFLWYNTEKPHRALGKLAPLRYYLDNYVTTPKQSNMLWTLTVLEILPYDFLLAVAVEQNRGLCSREAPLTNCQDSSSVGTRQNGGMLQSKKKSSKGY